MNKNFRSLFNVEEYPLYYNVFYKFCKANYLIFEKFGEPFKPVENAKHQHIIQNTKEIINNRFYPSSNCTND